MRIVRAGSNGNELLVNGSFEELQQGKPAHWSNWQQGYRVAPGEGRGGSQCVVCERREGEGEFGASQTLALNRTNIAPFIIRGWSKAENVSGSPDNGYSLYVDIVYADGSHLWGQTANFNCGTHDWENLVSACKQCNHRKAGRTPQEARMHLIHEPYLPRITPFYLFYHYLEVQADWRKFIPGWEPVEGFS